MTLPNEDFQILSFTQIVDLPVFAGTIKNKLGDATDIVFRLAETYPEAVGVYIEHGWNKPTEFVPWDRVSHIEHDGIFVKPPETGDHYPTFSDQPGWVMANEHLLGRTILDMDGRQIEVVNDAQLLKSKDRMLLVAVDISFNGFLRKWGLGWLSPAKDRFIPWKYVQPLSMEDVGTDTVSLSITRRQIKDLPGEDLADALEELTGEEQKAMFSALDSEKAAEVLAEVEPRTQRQLIATMRREKAKTVITEMSVPQLAALFSVLPHEQVTQLMELLPSDDADRIKSLLSEHESTAIDLMSSEYISAFPETRVGDMLKELRTSSRERKQISYIYVVNSEKVLLGAVDLRELVLASVDDTLENIMTSPVVVAEDDTLQDEVVELFQKYLYRILPVVDGQDHLLGVIYYKDVMQGVVARNT